MSAPADSSLSAGRPEPVLPSPRSRSGWPWRWIVLALIVLGVAVAWHEHGSASAERVTTGQTIVAVEKVGREDLTQTLAVSAEFHPYQQVALHAKVAGYLQSIWVDVGDRVKEGQAIAQLDVPELQDELVRATASLHAGEQEVTRAQAAHAEMHLAYTRLQEVAKDHPKLVAQQEVDTALARDATTASSISAAQQKVEEGRAEVNKVKAMVGYTSITAPFDGVITRRLADPGALIQAGTSANTSPLVEIVEDAKLRLVFPVPESAVPLIALGAPVRVHVDALNEDFTVKVSRCSGQVDRATRTMSTEADVENKDGRFKPGMMAEVNLITHESKGALCVPIQAVAGGERPMAMVVNGSSVLEARPLQLGLEMPDKAEVLAGLRPGELVLVGTRTGLTPGQKVSAKIMGSHPQ